MSSVLVKQLGDLLGFEDGAEDILDHLFTIESKADIKDYMVQLLGATNEALETLVDNIERVRNGEDLPMTQTDDETKDNLNQSQSRPDEDPTEPLKKQETISTAVTSNEREEVMKSRIVRTPGAMPAKGKGESSKSGHRAKNSSAGASLEEATKEEVRKKVLPKKGTASKVCGCFGNHHKALTNCLYCGRISCTEEGYDYCPFCGYMVEEVKPPSGMNSAEMKAWQHKERLLTYDKEFAQRTKIFDDQNDYYNSNWLNDDERLEAEEKEEERSRQMQQRGKMQLQLDL